MSMWLRIGWAVFILFAISIGLYPAIYLLFDMSGGLVGSKPEAVRESLIWGSAFYLHISFGGLALLTGWSQFLQNFRNRNLSFHRTLGKIYLISVAISGFCGLYIAFFATGGLPAALGFGGLALSWLYTTSAAYRSILAGNRDSHEKWMIRSYALTFAAVTLRIYLPLSTVAEIEFIDAYRVISWMCWVPNLFVAEIIIRQLGARKVVAPSL